MNSNTPKPSFIIAAHRGGRCQFEENTLDAFQHSLSHGANAIEMDMRFDHWNKRFYLEHDFFHSPKDKHNIADKVIPFLPDGTTLYIELKSLAWIRKYYVQQFLKAYDQFFREKRSLVISYNPFVLYHLRLLRPEIPIGYLCGNFFWGWIFRVFILPRLKPDFLFLHRRMLRSMLDYTRNLGMTVIAFGMDKSSDWEKAKELDIEGIVTDHPEEAARVIFQK